MFDYTELYLDLVERLCLLTQNEQKVTLSYNFDAPGSLVWKAELATKEEVKLNGASGRTISEAVSALFNTTEKK